MILASWRFAVINLTFEYRNILKSRLQISEVEPHTVQSDFGAAQSEHSNWVEHRLPPWDVKFQCMH